MQCEPVSGPATTSVPQPGKRWLSRSAQRLAHLPPNKPESGTSIGRKCNRISGCSPRCAAPTWVPAPRETASIQVFGVPPRYIAFPPRLAAESSVIFARVNHGSADRPTIPQMPPALPPLPSCSNAPSCVRATQGELVNEQSFRAAKDHGRAPVPGPSAIFSGRYLKDGRSTSPLARSIGSIPKLG